MFNTKILTEIFNEDGEADAIKYFGKYHRINMSVTGDYVVMYLCDDGSVNMYTRGEFFKLLEILPTQVAESIFDTLKALTYAD
jgi:hypothetical protein